MINVFYFLFNFPYNCQSPEVNKEWIVFNPYWWPMTLLSKGQDINEILRYWWNLLHQMKRMVNDIMLRLMTAKTKLRRTLLSSGWSQNVDIRFVLSVTCEMHRACLSNRRKRTLSWSTNEKGTKLIAKTTVGSHSFQWQVKFLPVFSP